MTRMDNRLIIKEKLSGYMLNQDKSRKERVIVSLTSYPARISFVSIAVKSLLLQTFKADRIILWLAEEQFPDKALPKDLVDLQQYGLEIKWIHDIYGHKKYFYPILKQQPNDVVITYDDDIIFPPRSIERLMKTHEKWPDCVVCERGQVYIESEQMNPGRWKTISSQGVNKPTFSMNPSPGGGCLIPYGAFSENATNESLIREYAYKNDDLWYMFMCAEKGTRIIKTKKYHRTFSTIKGSQAEQMAFENVIGSGNNVTMEKLCKRFPTAWERIKTNIL